MRLLEHAAIRFHILGRAVSDAISERQMSRELLRRDYRIGPGTLRLVPDAPGRAVLGSQLPDTSPSGYHCAAANG